jgi:hypothetical protein
MSQATGDSAESFGTPRSFGFYLSSDADLDVLALDIAGA